jgi:hypothetical protein
MFPQNFITAIVIIVVYWFDGSHLDREKWGEDEHREGPVRGYPQSLSALIIPRQAHVEGHSCHVGCIGRIRHLLGSLLLTHDPYDIPGGNGFAKIAYIYI